jgi:hypothetical protein
MSQRYMSIDRALAYMRKNTVFLHYDAERGVDLWTCGRQMPQSLRRSIFKHREQLRAMMRNSSPKTCPASDLHRFEWVLRGNETYVCEICERLEISMSGQDNHRLA